MEMRAAGRSPAPETERPARQGPTVTFVRRTSSGRYVNYSRDDLDSELGSMDFADYTVHLPPTPDNQPMAAAVAARVEEQYVSHSLFTGGFNTVTRAHLMDKVTDSADDDGPGRRLPTCAVSGCDGKVMDVLPCECNFRICMECYIEIVKAAGAGAGAGGGHCPGCKEEYKAVDMDELAAQLGRPLPLPAPKLERGLSLARNGKSMLMRSQPAGDWDHNRWLFETKGTYGYGNAYWPRDGEGGEDGGGGRPPAELLSKPWRPLTRKLKVPAAVLSPYRYCYQAYTILLNSYHSIYVIFLNLI